MSRKLSQKTTKNATISFDRDLFEFLLTTRNRSEYVNNAVREKMFRDKTPEIRIKDIKDRKRELAIKITELTAEQTKIEEKLIR